MTARQRFWKAVYEIAARKTLNNRGMQHKLATVVGSPGDRKTWRQIYDIASKNVLADQEIRHFMPSMIFSPEDLSTSDFLIELSTAAIRAAWNAPLDCGKPNLEDSKFLNVFPGEHYRLLSAITKIMEPRVVVEIGTWTGMGTLSLASGLPDDGTVYSFDILEWDQMPKPTHFETSDFAEGRIRQVIGDLTDDAVFDANRETLEAADIIFMDAPKDGRFEYGMLEKLRQLKPKQNRVLILDDIRFVNMIDLWRSIASPKLDLSSFGHWSGTGLVDMSQGLRVI